MIRDIHQLRDAPAFGVTAVEGLLSAEDALREALRHVPYCDGHRAVWSPTFARIILDAASQVDSVWKATARRLGSAGGGDRMTIRDHFDAFGSLVARQEVVFFGGPAPSALAPFREWQGGYSPLGWWDAYNALKHDRFSHQTEGTLEHAVHAVAALFLTAVYSGSCDLALISAQLLDPSDHNPWAFTKTGLLRDVTCDGHSKLETRLFAHPLGVFGADDCNLSNYWRSASPRFNIWWALNADRYTKRKP